MSLESNLIIIVIVRDVSENPDADEPPPRRSTVQKLELELDCDTRA